MITKNTKPRPENDLQFKTTCSESTGSTKPDTDFYLRGLST